MRSKPKKFRQPKSAIAKPKQTLSSSPSRFATLRSPWRQPARAHQEIAQRNEKLRDDLSAERARRGSLEQILNDRAYTAEAVQKLFAVNGEADSRGFRAVGVLADYAEVEEQYEGAIEQFLRDELEYVVVETFDHARAGISLLREEMGGRATFFVDSLRQTEIRATARPSILSSAGIVSRLDRLVEFRDPLGPAAKQFLSKLEGAYLDRNRRRSRKTRARKSPTIFRHARWHVLPRTHGHGRPPR